MLFLKPSFVFGSLNTCVGRRTISTKALDKWITTLPERTELRDTLHPEQLAKLYVTLPTRDGTWGPYRAPVPGEPLGYLHHFVFLNSTLVPERALNPADGTDTELGPPFPFTRRMWAGGKIEWDTDRPLLVGERVTGTFGIESVQSKGVEQGKPMVFVNKTLEVWGGDRMEGKPSVREQRIHVYLPELTTGSEKQGLPREVRDIPEMSDFSLSYRPTLVTLFRFSALTFNAHFIHLDKEYSRNVEGHSERLVHGPLTALMMLEAVVSNEPGSVVKAFTYRARNPLVLNKQHTIYGHYGSGTTIKLWCVSEDGVVGMTGEVDLQ